MGTTLITGGAGFIGSHLAEHLLRAGERVLVADDLSSGDLRNLPRHRSAEALEFFRVSVCDESAMRRLVERADRVFHLAAAVGVKLIVTDPFKVFEANVTGTATVLEICARLGRPVFVASSSEVYGKSQAIPYAEDADIVLGSTSRSRWSYACSKAMGEFLARAHFSRHGLPVVIARVFNTAGPRQTGRYGMVVPRFIAQALSGEPITVYGDGSQSRCFCHVHDLVAAAVRLLETRAAHGEVVNLGGDEPITIGALAERVRAITGSGSEIVHVPFEQAYEAGFEDMHARRPDLGKARELIGFSPRRRLDDILEDAIAGLRDARAAE